MKSMKTALVVAFATLSTAQNFGDLPGCAQTCVGNTIPATGCQILDEGCICKSSGWIAGLSCCISKTCNAAEIATTITFANQLCSSYGVTLPAKASCSGTAGSSVASSAASSGASGVASSIASLVSSASVSSTSAAAAAASGSSTTASGTSGMTSGMASPTTSATGTAAVVGSSIASSASAATSTGLAAHVYGQSMGAAGAALAALVLL